MLSDVIHPLHFFIAVGPVAVYLLLIGMINLSARPFVTTGARDAAAIGMAISGFVMVGPIRLLLPTATRFHWGILAWVLVVVFYFLTLALIVLMMRPRLVIYNIPSEQVRPILATLVEQLDGEARWAGDSLSLPRLGVQLHLESTPMLRNVQLVSAGPRQSFEGWKRLERALVQALRATTSERNPMGISLIISGLLIVAFSSFLMLLDSESVAQAFHEILQFSAEDPQ